jgi:hypothetical protein
MGALIGLYWVVFLIGLIVYVRIGFVNEWVAIMCGPGVVFLIGCFVLAVMTRGRLPR